MKHIFAVITSLIISSTGNASQAIDAMDIKKLPVGTKFLISGGLKQDGRGVQVHSVGKLWPGFGVASFRKMRGENVTLAESIECQFYVAPLSAKRNLFYSIVGELSLATPVEIGSRAGSSAGHIIVRTNKRSVDKNGTVSGFGCSFESSNGGSAVITVKDLKQAFGNAMDVILP